MTILIYCLLVSLLLPFLSKIPVAIAMNKLGGYDNQTPREQQAQLQGLGARALAGHKNAFEALAMFAPAVLLAIATNNIGDIMQYLAITHIVARIAYHACYLADLSTLRSIVWVVGLVASITMVVMCLP